MLVGTVLRVTSGVQRLITPTVCRGYVASPCRFVGVQTGLQQFRASSTKTSEKTSPIPTDRKFSDKHEWVLMEGNIGTVGISHYAQDALGDVVYAQLPDVGTTFEMMDECGALESVKAASELFCPLSGKVVEKNATVEETPGLINHSCYEKGWLFKLELTKPEELKDLMDDKTYDSFLKSQQE